MPQWHYLRSTPHRSLAAQIPDHVGQRGLRGELVCAAYHQAVLYFALKANDGATGALIIDANLSPETQQSVGVPGEFFITSLSGAGWRDLACEAHALSCAAKCRMNLSAAS